MFECLKSKLMFKVAEGEDWNEVGLGQTTVQRAVDPATGKPSCSFVFRQESTGKVRTIRILCTICILYIISCIVYTIPL